MTLLIKFAGPMYGIVAYLTGIYIWDMVVMDQISLVAPEVFMADQRHCTSELAFFHSREAFVGGSASFAWTTTPQMFQIARDLNDQVRIALSIMHLHKQ